MAIIYLYVRKKYLKKLYDIGFAVHGLRIYDVDVMYVIYIVDYWVTSN